MNVECVSLFVAPFRSEQWLGLCRPASSRSRSLDASLIRRPMIADLAMMQASRNLFSCLCVTANSIVYVPGILADLRNKWLNSDSRCMQDQLEEEVPSPMKLTPVAGLFGFVLGGFLLSMLLGAIEFFIKPKQDNSSKVEVRTWSGNEKRTRCSLTRVAPASTTAGSRSRYGFVGCLRDLLISPGFLWLSLLLLALPLSLQLSFGCCCRCSCSCLRSGGAR